MPIAPTTGNITAKFVEKWKHNGIDYDGDPGTPVKASTFGMVVNSSYQMLKAWEEIAKKNKNKGKKVKKFSSSYGNVIILYHGIDLWSRKHTYTLYAHLEKRSVMKFDIVNENDLIGTSGNSGTRQGFYNRKGGYTLHFEVLQSSAALKWVKTGDLDFRSVSESLRTDPERFLSFFVALSPQVKNPDNYPLSPKVLEALHLFSNYIGKDKTIVVTGGNREGDEGQHGKNTAADIKVPGQSHLQTANQAADSGLFRGIGWYEEGYYPGGDVGPHVHVDLRKETTARWGYDKKGKKCSGYFPKYPIINPKCP